MSKKDEALKLALELALEALEVAVWSLSIYVLLKVYELAFV